jgi:hypothetical protein
MSSTRGGVCLSRRCISCIVISHECTRTHAASRVRASVLHGHHTRFVTLLKWIILIQYTQRTSVNAVSCSRSCLSLFYLLNPVQMDQYLQKEELKWLQLHFPHEAKITVMNEWKHYRRRFREKLTSSVNAIFMNEFQDLCSRGLNLVIKIPVFINVTLFFCTLSLSLSLSLYIYIYIYIYDCTALWTLAAFSV